MKTTALAPALLFFFGCSSILTAAQQSDTAILSAAQQSDTAILTAAQQSETELTEQPQSDVVVGGESSFAYAVRLMTGFLQGLETDQAEVIARTDALQQAVLDAKLELTRQEHTSVWEAEQAKLDGALNEIMPSTVILNRNDFTQIHDWLEVDGSDGDFDLIYRASRDGFMAHNFHVNCDDKGPTVTIILTTKGHVVGAYSNTAWSRNGKYEKASKAFIFALFDSSRRPVRGWHPSAVRMGLKNKNDSYAVRQNFARGPIFGNGWRDLYVTKKMDKVRSYLGRSYKYSPSWPLKSGKYYDIKEIEIYRVSSAP